MLAGVALLGAAPAVPSADAAPRVHAMIAWRDGGVTGPRSMTLGSLRVGRCSIGEGSPLAVLRGFGKPFRVRGSCDALYVFQVGRDRERGAAGWVYKVGRRLPSTSASRYRVRSGAHVTWFWCREANACQRTLSMSVRSRRGLVRVTVIGYDDFGRGKRIRGATVAVSRPGRRFSVRSGRDGVAPFRTRRGAATRIAARKRGTIPSFPRSVLVR